MKPFYEFEKATFRRRYIAALQRDGEPIEVGALAAHFKCLPCNIRDDILFVSNPDAYRQAQRDRYAQNRKSKQVARQNKRAQKFGAEGTLTLEEWNACLERHGHACAHCGITDVVLALDHIVPVSKGGASTVDNIQPLCKPCNSRKRDR